MRWSWQPLCHDEPQWSLGDSGDSAVSLWLAPGHFRAVAEVSAGHSPAPRGAATLQAEKVKLAEQRTLLTWSGTKSTTWPEENHVPAWMVSRSHDLNDRGLPGSGARCASSWRSWCGCRRRSSDAARSATRGGSRPACREAGGCG